MLTKDRLSFGFPISALLLLSIGLLTEASAQPSDAQIKKDLTGAKTVSVTLGKPGTREWSSTYKKYIWTRDFTAKVRTDDPEIFVIVKGYASYDVIAGRYVYWRSFTTSNSYEGIPDPTAADVEAIIRKFGVEQILGSYYFNRVVDTAETNREIDAARDDAQNRFVSSIVFGAIQAGLSLEQGIRWHTPNSVSFNVTAVYTERTNDIGGKERVARTFEIRVYRDNPKQEWLRMISTPRDKKTL